MTRPYPKSVGIWAVAALLTVLVLVTGLDRAGAPMPGMGPFSQSYRARVLAAQLEDSQPASEQARQLVRYAPLRQGHLSLLALSLAYDGEEDAASQALAAALAAGWRDTRAQGLAVEQAIRGKEYAIAAQRIEALLRSDPDGDVTRAALALVAADAPSREALAGAMARNEPWATAALGGAATLDAGPLQDRLALIDAAREKGYRPDQLGARRFAQRLFERDPAAASSAWTALLGPGERASTGLWQGGFAGLADAELRTRGPFEWRRIPGSPLKIGTEGEALMIDGRASAADTVAIQHLMIEPGAYALAWRTAERARGEPAITLTLQCPASPASMRQGPVLEIEGQFARSVEVMTPCAAALRVMSMSGKSGERRLEDVVLGRAG
ncbi:hypothetical protein [Qipengyuania sphaerica]|uniref:hypothetical protein n=1 Tax=Qipengyuania sphaerica TaxID=2867243 RepID=UPI001C86B067|nr:hypothetical protein [Qipengyuania sphaerica]MBX7540895.1 hypothetical protein [Qipengyuania sphaerica]